MRSERGGSFTRGGGGGAGARKTSREWLRHLEVWPTPRDGVGVSAHDERCVCLRLSEPHCPRVVSHAAGEHTGGEERLLSQQQQRGRSVRGRLPRNHWSGFGLGLP